MRKPAVPQSAAPRQATVRQAGPQDLDALDAIETAAFTTDRFSRRNLRRMLASPAALALIAADGEATLGYALLLFRSGSTAARLYSIAVTPAARGRGLAATLLAAAEDAARRRGAKRLRLEVRSSNAAALRLYERAGFASLRRLPGYYLDGADALRMEKTIAPATQGDRSAKP